MHVTPRICGDVFGLMNSLHVPERCVEPSACGSLTLFLPEEQGALSGNAGDWLVQHTDGGFGIVADDIFERTYELVT